MKRFSWSLVLRLLVVSACAGCVEMSTTTAPPPQPNTLKTALALANQYAGSQPNFVIVLTDDQRVDLSFNVMPLTKALLVDSGTRFVNAVSNAALCCPARASLLSSKYVHNHGVLMNSAPHGGAGKFRGPDNSTVATELRALGYVTGVIGKYLNSYEAMAFPTWPYIPPGWDEWRVFSPEPHYYNYKMVEKAFDSQAVKTVTYSGSGSAKYSTNVIKNQALSFIDKAPADKPLFLLFAPFAPHADWPNVPPLLDPIDNTACNQYSFAHLPSVNEADVSDKPRYVQAKPLLTKAKLVAEIEMKRKMCRSLQSVDRAVRDIVVMLANTGRLANTYIFYLSDQGFQLGEHRLRNQKLTPYTENTTIPLAVRGPGVLTRVDSNVVQTVDVTTTIRALAGASVQGDGVSLQELLTGLATGPHTSVLIESYRPDNPHTEFSAIRTKEYLYVEFPAGGLNGEPFVELYHLPTDPYQMTNVKSTAPHSGIVATLASQLAALKVK